MTFPTHLFAGLAIGAATGDYSVAIGASILPDLDHAVSYARHDVFRSADTFWSVITSENDPWSDQRYILHNIVCAAALIFLINFVFPGHLVTLTLSYGVHLLLDALDAADYFPLFPWKGINLKGPIHYNSKWEYSLAIFFLVLFLIQVLI